MLENIILIEDKVGILGMKIKASLNPVFCQSSGFCGVHPLLENVTLHLIADILLAF